MIGALFQALYWPPLLLAQLIVGFSWPAAVVFSAIIALVVGAMLALNHGTKAPRWIVLPLLLAHVQVFVHGQLGVPAWWVVVALMAASIGWLICRCRETLVAALLFAWFCLVYGGTPALVIYASA